ncbi:MAG: isoprenylcysteine carboxylmethyltransferase family protein [Planctomycetota bacterium]|nr:MAG: isoprenylcysteine carboxylmethyltransferase family protein [Planctomycetota bacterium]
MKLLLKNLLFTILVPGSVAGWVPWVLSGGGIPEAPWRLAFGGLLFLFGGSIYFWCLLDFIRQGRATPFPLDAPKSLVIRGLYQYSRNPMYVGVLGVICGWVIWTGNLNLIFYAAAVFLMFQAFIFFYEEPHLRKEFGNDYLDYCRRVPRWLNFKVGSRLD